MNRYPECRHEDFPCCGCYDTVEAEPEFDDFDDDPDYDDEDTDDEDVIAIRGAREKNPVQKFIDASREYDMDRPWDDAPWVTEDYDFDTERDY